MGIWRTHFLLFLSKQKQSHKTKPSKRKQLVLPLSASSSFGTFASSPLQMVKTTMAMTLMLLMATTMKAMIFAEAPLGPKPLTSS